MEEYWKDVKEFEGYYQISSHGRVKSLEREVNYGNHIRLKKESILKPIYRSDMIHPYYNLYDDLKKVQTNVISLLKSNFDIRRLEYPVEYDDSFLEIHHIEDDFVDYKIENLYYDIKKSVLRVFDYEGNFISDFPDIRTCADSLKLSYDLVDNSLRFGSICIKENGFQIRKVITNAGVASKIKQLPSLVNKMRSDTIPIAKYHNDRLICVYNSLTEAAENNLLSSSVINQNIKYGYYANGFTFKIIT